MNDKNSFWNQAAKAGLVLGGVSAHLCKLVLEFGHLDAVFVGEVFLGVELVALLHHFPHGGVAHEHRVEHGVFVKLEVVLAQHGEAFARAHLHGALVRFEFARDGFQQRGLAGAVGTDDAVDVAAVELEVDVLVQYALAELYGQVGKGYH